MCAASMGILRKSESFYQLDLGRVNGGGEKLRLKSEVAPVDLVRGFVPVGTGGRGGRRLNDCGLFDDD